jgi:hypothetical protein
MRVDDDDIRLITNSAAYAESMAWVQLNSINHIHFALIYDISLDYSNNWPHYNYTPEMKVLILGATGESSPLSLLNPWRRVGFIGLPAAQAFVRGGHIVYGQTRSEKLKGELTKEEIIPIVLDPATDEGVKAFVEVAKNVDVGMSS